MGTTHSKLTPVPYSCYEVCHTWSPYCTVSAVDVGLACIVQSLQIYSTIYLGGAVVSGRLTSKQDFVNMIKSIMRSTIFLTYNAFGFVAAHCGLRLLFGHSNFWSLSFMPGWLCSFLAIFVEKHSRRSLLATYVTNVASESMYNSLVQHELMKPIKHLDFVLFAASVTGFMYLSNCQPHLKDPTLKLTRIIADDKSSKNSAENQDPGTENVEKEVVDICKKSLKHLMVGVAGQTAFNCLKSIRSGKKMNFGFRNNSSLGLFAASMTFISRATKLLLRKSTGKDSSWHSAVAGLVSSPSYFLFPSKTAAFYLFWKLVEIYIKLLNEKGRVPTVPYFTELVYATSTGILFYFGMLEPHNLRKSYLDFLNRITGDKILGVNHGLIDEVYGFDSSQKYDHKPVYQAKFISEELKRRLPQHGSMI